jgi:hypothetical protein
MLNYMQTRPLHILALHLGLAYHIVERLLVVNMHVKDRRQGYLITQA